MTYTANSTRPRYAAAPLGGPAQAPNKAPLTASATPDSGRAWLPFRQRRVRLRLIRGLDFDADAVSQRNLVANEDIAIATPSAAHEDDARFVSHGEKGVGDAGWGMDEVPLRQAVLRRPRPC